MAQHRSLLQLVLVAVLTIVWVLITINQPYPPSRWNLIFVFGVPFAVASGFAGFGYWKHGRSIRPIRFFLWFVVLCGWEFCSVMAALTLHGT